MENKVIVRTLVLIAIIWIGKNAVSKFFSSDHLEFKPITKQELDESKSDIHAGDWQFQRPIKAEAHKPAPFFKVVPLKKDSETTTVAGDKTAPAGTIKAEAGAPANIAGKTDPKKDEKKKKKKKEAPKVAKVAAANPVLPGESKSTNTATPNLAGAAAPVQPVAPVTDKSKPKTVSEWAAILFNPLTFESLSKMTSYYQAGAMDSATYYGLIDKILAEYGPNGKEYVGLALANVPSYESFVRLAALTSSDSPPVVARAQEALMVYAKPRNISSISKALESKNPYVRYQALLVIRETANTLVTTNNISTSRPVRSYASVNFTGLFGPLVPMLESMRSVEAESRLIQEINRTLASVSDLLSRASSQQVTASGH